MVLPSGHPPPFPNPTSLNTILDQPLPVPNKDAEVQVTGTDAQVPSQLQPPEPPAVLYTVSFPVNVCAMLLGWGWGGRYRPQTAWILNWDQTWTLLKGRCDQLKRKLPLEICFHFPLGKDPINSQNPHRKHVPGVMCLFSDTGWSRCGIIYKKIRFTSTNPY